MFLILAALLLLVVIVSQNVLYPPLRQETISDGLYGPYHWFLDGAYVVLGTALVLAFKGTGLPALLADGAATALAVTAISNTFSGFVDKITKGKHALIHTWFSILMFLTMIGLQVSVDQGKLWWLTVAGLVVPAAIAGVLTLWKKLGIITGPAAEKTAVLFLCVWLIVWSLVR